MENYIHTDHGRINSMQRRMLMFLKMRGAQPASAIAKEYGMTSEGARLHLLKMMDEELVKQEHVSKGVGRPTILYSLTEKGHERFPDSHADLTTQLLASVKRLLGQEALDRLIEAREKETLRKYTEAMRNLDDVEEKIIRLVEIRAEEGYMAEWQKGPDSYLFIENHCPICAAATECPEFCHSELKNFRQVLGKNVQIERVEHIVQGGRRCTYKIIHES